MPRATLFEDDMEIKIFIWNTFTEDLFRQCMARKFGGRFKDTPKKDPFIMPADAVDHLQQVGPVDETGIAPHTEKSITEKKLQEATFQHLLSDGPKRGRPRKVPVAAPEKAPMETPQKHYIARGLRDKAILYAFENMPMQFTSKQYKEKILNFYHSNNSTLNHAGIDTICCKSLKELIQDKKIVKLKYQEYKKREKKSIEKTEEPTNKKDDAPADNNLSKKMMTQSDGGDWDTADDDILRENFFAMGGKAGGAEKIAEAHLIPGCTVDMIKNRARHMGLML
jgi:hypothetical protein